MINGEQINFKKILNEKFYNDLVKCNFIDDLNKMILNNGIVNITIDDIINVSNYEIVGSISQTIEDMNEDLIVKYISDEKPNICILYLFVADRLKLSIVDRIMTRIKKLFADIEILIGVGENINSADSVEISALLLSSDLLSKDVESIEFTKNNNDFVKKEKEKVEEHKKMEYKNELDLIYDIALFCVDNNKCSINMIQNEFQLGFNNAVRKIELLEDLKIISHKVENTPRIILIKDKDEIKRRIYSKEE